MYFSAHCTDGVHSPLAFVHLRFWAAPYCSKGHPVSKYRINVVLPSCITITLPITTFTSISCRTKISTTQCNFPWNWRWLSPNGKFFSFRWPETVLSPVYTVVMKLHLEYMLIYTGTTWGWKTLWEYWRSGKCYIQFDIINKLTPKWVKLMMK